MSLPKAWGLAVSLGDIYLHRVRLTDAGEGIMGRKTKVVAPEPMTLFRFQG